MDTQVFLLWNEGHTGLSKKALRTLADPDNTLIFSVASAWEIAIKIQLGKLRLPEDTATYVRTRAELYRMESLPIHLAHALALASLPPLHRDPFDRILIAQSQIENIPIVTADPAIRRYPVDAVW